MSKSKQYAKSFKEVDLKIDGVRFQLGPLISAQSGQGFVFHGVLASQDGGASGSCDRARHAVIKLLKSSHPGPEYEREVQAFVRLHPEDWNEAELDWTAGVAAGTDFPVFTDHMPMECRRFNCRMLAFSKNCEVTTTTGRSGPDKRIMPAIVLPTAHTSMVGLIGSLGRAVMPWRVTARVLRTQALATLWAHCRGVFNLDMKLDNILVHFSPDGSSAGAASAREVAAAGSGVVTPIATDFGHAYCLPIEDIMPPGDISRFVGRASLASLPDACCAKVGRSFGTPQWRPPEAARSGWRTGRTLDLAKVDAFGLGVMLWCVHFGRWMPWSDISKVAHSVGIRDPNEFFRVKDIVGPHPFNPLWKDYGNPDGRDRLSRALAVEYQHSGMRDLVDMLTHPDPSKRLSVRQALWHPALRLRTPLAASLSASASSAASAPPRPLLPLPGLPVPVPATLDALEASGAATGAGDTADATSDATADATTDTGAGADAEAQGGGGDPTSPSEQELYPLPPSATTWPTPDPDEEPDAEAWKELCIKRLEGREPGKLHATVEAARQRATAFAAAMVRSLPGWDAVKVADKTSSTADDEKLAQALFGGAAAVAASHADAVEDDGDISTPVTDTDASSPSEEDPASLPSSVTAPAAATAEAQPPSPTAAADATGSDTGSATISLRIRITPGGKQQVRDVPLSSTGRDLAKLVLDEVDPSFARSDDQVRLVYNGRPLGVDQSLRSVNALSGGLVVAFRPLRAGRHRLAEEIKAGAETEAQRAAAAPSGISAAFLADVITNALSRAATGCSTCVAPASRLPAAVPAPAQDSASSDASTRSIAGSAMASAISCAALSIEAGQNVCVLRMTPAVAVRTAAAALGMLHHGTGSTRVLVPTGHLQPHRATPARHPASGDSGAEAASAAGSVSDATTLALDAIRDASSGCAAPSSFPEPGTGPSTSLPGIDQLERLAAQAEAGEKPVLSAEVAACTSLVATDAMPSILAIAPPSDGTQQGSASVSTRQNGAVAEAHARLLAVLPVRDEAGQWEPGRHVRVFLATTAVDKGDGSCAVRVSAFPASDLDAAVEGGEPDPYPAKVADSVAGAVHVFLSLLDCRV